MAARAALARSALCASISAPPPVSSFPFRTTYSSAPSRRVFRCRVHSEGKLEPVTQVKEDAGPSDSWKIKMLYDGDCPLCMREVNFLRGRNKSYGAIKFVDISSKDYSAEENQGLDYQTVMGRIHAIQSDGTVVRDVEAFQRLYEEVGLGWLYAITKYEPIATMANAVYSVWAKYRLQITGRPSLEDIMESRRKNVVLDLLEEMIIPTDMHIILGQEYCANCGCDCVDLARYRQSIKTFEALDYY